ncbi:MAG: hypothetical protein ACUVXF_02915 [Desulfobaccales bacterium]
MADKALLLNQFDFITVYWLSGWLQEKFEVWKGKKDPEQPDPDAVRFTLYLLAPLLEEEPSRLTIFDTEDGFTFMVDWFEGEKFPLKVFASENPRQLLLMSEFQWETVFVHLS